MIHLTAWSRAQLLQLGAAVLLGILLGMAGAAFVFGKQLDQVTLDNARLTQGLEELERDYERLKEGTSGTQRPVRTIELRFLNLRDERVRLQLDRHIKELLSDRILGKAVGQIDPLLAANVVDDRTFDVDNQGWKVTVRGSYFIWDTLIIYMDAEQRPSPVFR